jgi:hypothetical protein
MGTLLPIMNCTTHFVENAQTLGQLIPRLQMDGSSLRLSLSGTHLKTIVL